MPGAVELEKIRACTNFKRCCWKSSWRAGGLGHWGENPFCLGRLEWLLLVKEMWGKDPAPDCSGLISCPHFKSCWGRGERLCQRAFQRHDVLDFKNFPLSLKAIKLHLMYLGGPAWTSPDMKVPGKKVMFWFLSWECKLLRGSGEHAHSTAPSWLSTPS